MGWSNDADYDRDDPDNYPPHPDDVGDGAVADCEPQLEMGEPTGCVGFATILLLSVVAAAVFVAAMGALQ